jgi:hypothetical protein
MTAAHRHLSRWNADQNTRNNHRYLSLDWFIEGWLGREMMIDTAVSSHEDCRLYKEC